MSFRSVLCIIPARYASCRLPGKPLVELGGRPMIEWVYRRAERAGRTHEVLVATDDDRVLSAVEAFGGRAVLTSAACPSGTDRVAEALGDRSTDLVINLQGDEPLIEPAALDQLVAIFEQEPRVAMATLMCRMGEGENVTDPNIVKVVVDSKGYALYFSRYPIPYCREPGQPRSPHYRHYGLYAFRPDTLKRFVRLEPSPLERMEQLEQLRALENGIRIRVVETPYRTMGVDTPEDLERVRRLVEAEGLEP